MCVRDLGYPGLGKRRLVSPGLLWAGIAIGIIGVVWPGQCGLVRGLISLGHAPQSSTLGNFADS